MWIIYIALTILGFILGVLAAFWHGKQKNKPKLIVSTYTDNELNKTDLGSLQKIKFVDPQTPQQKVDQIFNIKEDEQKG